MKPVISLVASANRVQWWPRLLDSLKGNKIPYEVIFVGDVNPGRPMLDKYPELKWIHATVKPAQCYQIGFWAAQGDLIAWTADDSDYSVPARVLPVHQDCFDPLDRAYALWKDMENRYNHDGKSVVAFRPIEDGGDVYKFHRLFGGCSWSPVMAPFGLVPRKYLSEPGKGYDDRFVSGQSENDIIMQVFEDGGRVEQSMDAFLYVHHRQVHPRTPDGNREDNKFRKWYNTDRVALENAWIVEGYGSYEKYTPEQLQNVVHISPKRLTPVQPFAKTPDVCFVTQGVKGHWQ